MKLGPAVLDLQVLSLDPTGFAEPLAKGGQRRSICLGRRPVEEADHRHRLLLCQKRTSRNNRAAQQHQLAAVYHSMTSVAQARIDGGTVRPSALAVLRLTTSSNRVGCWTGRSAGLAPVRILST